MINEIVLIRTHFFNHRIKNLIKFFREYFGDNVYVVCPERVVEKLDPATAGNLSRFISLREGDIVDMGLLAPPRWEWACGDYALYRARAAHPEASRYWLIEYDVVVNSAKASQFFSRFAADEADFLAVGYEQADASWPWYKTMRPLDDAVMRCFFSAVRLSAAAIDHLLAGRRALAASVAPQDWPNDEAFVATTLTAAGFTCRALDREIATDDSFTWERPHSLQEMKGRGPDGLLYHPVVAGPAYVRKARQFIARYPERFGEIAATLRAEANDLDYEILSDRAAKPLPPAVAQVEDLAIRAISTVIEGRPVRFAVAHADDLIQSHHLGGRFYEWQELSIIGAHFPAGGTFCDIGANVGNHTIYAGLFLGAARIVVFEPNPVAIPVLQLNIALNGLQNVVDSRYLGIGLGSGPGQASMSTPERNLGGNMLDPANPDGTIEVRSGDACLAGTDVSFLKIDVEGMELQVLEGLAGTIARCRPPIFIEVLDAQLPAVNGWCAANGYDVVETYRRYVTCKNLMLKARQQ